MRSHLSLSFVLLTALFSGCAGPATTSSSEVIAAARDRLPVEPGDTVWDEVPFHLAELLLQDMVEPRLLEPSTPDVRVQAVTDGRRVAFRLAWTDESRSDLPGASRFVDACAVQLPGVTEPDVPAPQMGEEARAVEISFWRASWQAVVDGREDVIQALYPNAAIDHYPFEAPSLEAGSAEQEALARQYAPARALENIMEGPRSRPVEDLLAEGPGTLTRMPEQFSEGSGRWTGTGWEVVIVRPLPGDLSPGQRSQAAFAIWEGGREEVGARKMRSGWIPLHILGDER